MIIRNDIDLVREKCISFIPFLVPPLSDSSDLTWGKETDFFEIGSAFFSFPCDRFLIILIKSSSPLPAGASFFEFPVSRMKSAFEFQAVIQ